MTRPFYARHYRLILVLVAFSLPFISRGTRLAIEGNNNDIRDWLPADYPESADVKWFQKNFLGEQFALVSWNGCTLGNTEKLKLLSGKLVARDPNASRTERSKFFSQVVTGPEMLAQMTQPPLGLSEREALRRLEGSLIGPAPEGQGDAARTTCLMVTLSEEGKRTNRNKRLALQEIEAAAQECAIAPTALHMGGPPVDNVAIDVEGERTLYRLAVLSGLVGLGLAYWVFRSIRLTIMVFAVGVVSAGLSLAIVYYFGLLERLTQGLDVARFGTVDAILMTMPAVVYVLGLSGAIHIVNYYRDACRHDGTLGAAETAVRHGWVPCLLAALTTAVGLLSLFTSDITPIRKFGLFSAFGVLGTLALLFTLLPACLYRFAGGDKETSVRKSSPGSDSELPPWGRHISNWIIRRHGWVCGSWAVVMVVLAVGLTRIETRVQLLKLFASDADIISDYRWLETHLGNLVPMELVVSFDPSVCRTGDMDAESDGTRYQMTLLERLEMVERIQANVESLQDVGRSLSVATFVPEIPSSGTQMMRVGQRFAFNSTLEEHYRDELLSSEFLSEGPLAPGARSAVKSADADSQLWRISARVAALSDVDYGLFVAELRGVVEPVVAVYRERDRVLAALAAKQMKLRRSRLAIVTTAPDGAASPARVAQIELLQKLLRQAGAQVRVARLPQDTAGRPLVSEPLTEWFKSRDAVILTDSGAETAALDRASISAATVIDLQSGSAAAAAPPHAAIETTYTGIVPLVYKTQRELLVSLRQSIAWAVGLIAVVMMCVLRSPSAGLISMIPNIFPIVIVFGAMGWLGVKIDIGIMMTASVALGVAVDDTVHFLFWFRRGAADGMTPPEATRLAYHRCARAMMQTTLIGGFGLSVFAVSTFTPTQQFGILMLTLLAAALVGDLLLLPAILAGPAGRIFSGRLQARQATRELPPGEAGSPVAIPHERSETHRKDTSHRSINA